MRIKKPFGTSTATQIASPSAPPTAISPSAVRSPEPQQQPAMAVETKSAAEVLPRNDTQQEDTQEGWYLPPTWPSSAGGGICCCCSCFVSCAARFINDLAHFVAFYCECCVSRLGLIVDEHAERVQAQQQQQL